MMRLQGGFLVRRRLTKKEAERQGRGKRKRDH